MPARGTMLSAPTIEGGRMATYDVGVVKTLNTVTARVMVEPESVAGGDHTMFVAGNKQAAKAETIGPTFNVKVQR
jgi:hypothetical protein